MVNSIDTYADMHQYNPATDRAADGTLRQEPTCTQDSCVSSLEASGVKLAQDVSAILFKVSMQLIDARLDQVLPRYLMAKQGRFQLLLDEMQVGWREAQLELVGLQPNIFLEHVLT